MKNIKRKGELAPDEQFLLFFLFLCPPLKKRGYIALHQVLSVSWSVCPSIAYNLVQSITSLVRPSLFKLQTNIGHREEMFPIDFRGIGIKVKVTVTFNIEC